jgi:hypothetical protein
MGAQRAHRVQAAAVLGLEHLEGVSEGNWMVVSKGTLQGVGHEAES